MSLNDILLSLFFSLLVTLIIEEAIALCWRCKAKDQLRIALANCLTNPLVVFLFIVLVLIYNANRTAVLCVLELGAVISEALIFKKTGEIRRPVLFSITANAASYFLGVIISVLI